MKPKKCKQCQKIYEPTKPLQQVCSYECAIAKAKAEREKKEAKEMEEQQLNKAWQDGAVTAQNDAAKEIENNYVARVR